MKVIGDEKDTGGSLRKRRINMSGFALGLVCASLWYVVFGIGVLLHLDYPTHIQWDRVTIAAVVSFIVGWGTVHIISRLGAD
jgi:hypothetical protein